MNELCPTSLFDLSESSHAELFENCAFAWEALPKIEGYLRTFPLGKIDSPVPSSAFLINAPRIFIDKGVTVEPGACIKGPCIIGKNTTIRHGAYIREHVIIGDYCVVGHCSEIKHSVLLNRAKTGHFAYLGDSILGNDTNLGAGTKCANLRFDRKNIPIFINERKLDTGLRKLGAVLGDGSQTGCNTVTNPGTIMGKGASCYPCVVVGGYIPNNQVVKAGKK